jgi:hypothetical protein
MDALEVKTEKMNEEKKVKNLINVQNESKYLIPCFLPEDR